MNDWVVYRESQIATIWISTASLSFRGYKKRQYLDRTKMSPAIQLKQTCIHVKIGDSMGHVDGNI